MFPRGAASMTVRPRDESIKAIKLQPELWGKTSRFCFALLSLGKIFPDVELFAARASSLQQSASSSVLAYTQLCTPPTRAPHTSPPLNQNSSFPGHGQDTHCRTANIPLNYNY